MKEAEVTTVKDDNGMIVLAVKFNSGKTQFPVAYGKISSNFILAPQEGDVVGVEKTDSERYVATCVISKSENNSPEVSSGGLAYQLDPENSIQVKEGENGYDVIINITGEVNIQSGGNVSISSDGTVSVDAAEEVTIGESGVPVAKQDHTHNFDYSWGDDGGSGSGTTTEPNENGTETKIQ